MASQILLMGSKATSIEQCHVSSFNVINDSYLVFASVNGGASRPLRALFLLDVPTRSDISACHLILEPPRIKPISHTSSWEQELTAGFCHNSLE